MRRRPKHLAPFDQLVEHNVLVDNALFGFASGYYGGDDMRGAIQVIAKQSGTPHMTLTVHLVERPLLLPTNFFCKVSDDPAYANFVRRAGGKAPFFMRYGEAVSAGRVRRYAEEWGFAPCAHAHHPHDPGILAVFCSGCAAERKPEIEDFIERRDARETVAILKKKIDAKKPLGHADSDYALDDDDGYPSEQDLL